MRWLLALALMSGCSSSDDGPADMAHTFSCSLLFTGDVAETMTCTSVACSFMQQSVLLTASAGQAGFLFTVTDSPPVKPTDFQISMTFGGAHYAASPSFTGTTAAVSVSEFTVAGPPEGSPNVCGDHNWEIDGQFNPSPNEVHGTATATLIQVDVSDGGFSPTERGGQVLMSATF